MKNTGFALLAILSSVLAAIVTLVACSPTSDSSSSTSAPSSSLTGTWERSCYPANYDEEYGEWGWPVKIYGKQEVVITSETLTSTTTGFTDANCSTEIGTVIVTGKYLLGNDVEVYPVKEAEVFDLAKVSAQRAGLYQLDVSITPKTSDAVAQLKDGYYVDIPLRDCKYEDWKLDQATSVTQCHSFEPYNTSDIRYTTDQKAFAVFKSQVINCYLKSRMMLIQPTLV